ncbi:MAG: hypothetical protein HWN67_21335 [Candidatus Helarchaeota archaeon]|nr:hypothetical protein [Candidatus Helarchaeota archaeon]
MSSRKNDDKRDQKIDDAKQNLKKIRKDLEKLKETDTSIDFTKIGEVLDALSEIIQKLPDKIPKSEIHFKYLNEILHLLEESNQSNIALLVDVETKLVILGYKIHLVGVIQKIIKKPDRRKTAPRGKIWKNIKACFPRFKGFNVKVWGGGVYMTKADSFSVKLEDFKYKNEKTDSSLSSSQSRNSVFQELMSLIRSFLSWEIKKYRVDEHLRTWTFDKDLLVKFEFDWRSYEERYDITR